MIKVTGNGLLFINTFGAIDKHTLQHGQKLVVDNFHLVAFSDTCQYRVIKFGGLKETINMWVILSEPRCQGLFTGCIKVRRFVVH